MQARLILITLFGFLTGTGHLALAQSLCSQIHSEEAPIKYEFRRFEASQTRSQVVRDNHLDFSFFVRSYLQTAATWTTKEGQWANELFSHRGWISGDNHAGNYVVSMMNGRMKYFFMDIKDGGRGPWALNFANLVMNTHVVAKQGGLKLKLLNETLTGAYLQGLRGEPREVPALITAALATTRETYETLRRRDVKRFMNKQGLFAFSSGRVQRLEESIGNAAGLKEQMRESLKLLPLTGEIVDFAIRPKERGGSKDLLRIWALMRDSAGEFQIIEFKKIGTPAAEAVESSGLSLKEHTETMMQTYWGERDHMQSVVMLNGESFLLRPRKIELISVPYKQKTLEDQQKLLELATWAAYETGLRHRNQPGSAAYLQHLQSEPELFQQSIRQFVKAYLEKLEQRLEGE